MNKDTFTAIYRLEQLLNELLGRIYVLTQKFDKLKYFDTYRVYISRAIKINKKLTELCNKVNTTQFVSISDFEEYIFYFENLSK